MEPFLLEEQMVTDPHEQFDKWFKSASARDDFGEQEVNAVALSTVGTDSRPSSRMVLLKGYSNLGFIFFSSTTSRKGRELAHNPNAAMLFYWPAVDRQIRIEGVVDALDTKVSMTTAN